MEPGSEAPITPITVVPSHDRSAGPILGAPHSNLPINPNPLAGLQELATASLDSDIPPADTKSLEIADQLKKLADLPLKTRLNAVISTEATSVSSQIIQGAENLGEFKEDGRLHELNVSTLQEAQSYESSLPPGIEQDSKEAQDFTIAQSDNLESRIHLLENIAYPPEGTTLTPQQQEIAQAAHDALQVLDKGGLQIFYDGKSYSREQWQTLLDSLPDDERDKAESSDDRGVWQFATSEQKKEPTTLAEVITSTITDKEAKIKELEGIKNRTKDQNEELENLDAEIKLLQFAQLADGKEFGPALQREILLGLDIKLSDEEKTLAAIDKRNFLDNLDLKKLSEDARNDLQKLLEGDSGFSFVDIAQKVDLMHDQNIKRLFFSDTNYGNAKQFIENYGQQLALYFAKKGKKFAGIVAIMLSLIIGKQFLDPIINQKH